MKIKDTFSAPKQEDFTASLCYLGVPTEETESSDDSVFTRTVQFLWSVLAQDQDYPVCFLYFTKIFVDISSTHK